ncbi:MAG: transglutaminase-like domain-containing protein [Candidatus Hydrogenedentota bacterium]
MVKPILCLCTSVLLASAAAGGDPLGHRDVQLTYTATVPTIPEDAKVIDLWLPVAQDTDGQTVSKVTVNYPEGGAIATERGHGNKIWHKRFEAPFDDDLHDGAIGAEIAFEIHRTEIVVQQAKDLSPTPKVTGKFAKYLEPNRLIPINIDPINATAENLYLKDAAPIVAARRIYDWLITEFTYNWKAPGAGTGDVRWACDSKTGDCTDYHSTFLALCRNQGIPADHEFGYPIRLKTSEGKIPSYHCWARFHVEGVGWIPIDASEADKHPEIREYNFGSQSQDLLKFTHGRDVVLTPPQQGPPLNVFIHPYVEIDGKPYEEVTEAVYFRDLGTKALLQNKLAKSV